MNNECPKSKGQIRHKYIFYRYRAELGKRLDNDMVRRYIYRAKRCFENELISRQSASTYVKDKNTNANCIMPAMNGHLN